jgi:hypothetical protein
MQKHILLPNRNARHLTCITRSAPHVSGKVKLGAVTRKSLSPPARCRHAAVATAAMEASDTTRLRWAQSSSRNVAGMQLLEVTAAGVHADSQMESARDCSAPPASILEDKVHIATQATSCAGTAIRCAEFACVLCFQRPHKCCSIF